MVYLIKILLATVLPLPAAQVSEDFSTRSQFESATAVWNTSLGKIHPTLRVIDYEGVAAVTPLPFSVGDGSNGSFDPTTYAQFSVGGDISGNKIRFNTAAFPTLQVTSFNLAAGWVLEPVGNLPLVIYSQGDVDIQGAIWCHGHDGENAVGATLGAGGDGRCGGANGGDGGAVSASGADGGTVDGTVTGGQAGNFVGAGAVGGGGGGSWNQTTAAGPGFGQSGAGGTAGLSATDPHFVILKGGAGGGGGSGTNTEAGAGGGGGGGVVVIHAVGDVNIGATPASAFGFIYVNGGKGGDSDVNGGAGGGGGGGGIKIFSGGAIHAYNTNGSGAAQAYQGTDGTNLSGENGAFGGPGRNWLASVSFTGPGFYSPAEELPVEADNNTAEFSSDPQLVTLKRFDLESTLPILGNVTLTPASGDFTVEFRGSSDDFSSDDTGWVTSLSEVSGKRYVQLRVRIQTSSPAAPTMLDAVTLTYTAGQLKNFKFTTGGGCGRISPNSGAGGNWQWLLMLLPVLLVGSMRLRSTLSPLPYAEGKFKNHSP